MTEIVETSALQILGSSYYFPDVYSHALALVSLLPPQSLLTITMQNSFQNLAYATMVNQSMFIGEMMENTETWVCLRLLNFCPLKYNLLLQRWLKNVMSLLTA